MGRTNAEPYPRPAPLALPSWSPRVGTERSLRPPGSGPEVPFGEVLDRRSTHRAMSPVSDDRLSELLWHAARAREARGAWQHRAAASAGGLHPIHLLVIPAAGRGVAIYDPTRHRNRVLDGIEPDALRAAVDEVLVVDSCREATLILLAAEVNRTASVYENAESLVWRDAGCLLATLQLVCAWLSMACCPLGVLGAPLLRACGADGSVVAAGLLAVGEPKSALLP